MTPANAILRYLATRHGNIDVRAPLPLAVTYVPGERLQPLCRALGIDFRPAFVGWTGRGRHIRPHLAGVVIPSEDFARLMDARDERDRRSSARKIRRVVREMEGRPHCNDRKTCGVAPGHYDASCLCPCATCSRQREALRDAAEEYAFDLAPPHPRSFASDFTLSENPSTPA